MDVRKAIAAFLEESGVVEEGERELQEAFMWLCKRYLKGGLPVMLTDDEIATIARGMFDYVVGVHDSDPQTEENLGAEPDTLGSVDDIPEYERFGYFDTHMKLVYRGPEYHRSEQTLSIPSFAKLSRDLACSLDLHCIAGIVRGELLAIHGEAARGISSDLRAQFVPAIAAMLLEYRYRCRGADDGEGFSISRLIDIWQVFDNAFLAGVVTTCPALLMRRLLGVMRCIDMQELAQGIERSS